jgi:predicted CoA-binding protein
VYRRLKERGYEVFAINPNASTVEGDTSYPSLSAVPGGVDAVVVATGPEHTQKTVRECHRLGIRYVWMHRGPGSGSVSTTAAEYGRDHGLSVIDGGCPLMFKPVSDGGHRVMRAVLTAAGNVPREV